jgi:ribosomal protein S18 acetylase RimI-like enzyme
MTEIIDERRGEIYSNGARSRGRLYCVIVEGLTIRRATPGDTNRIAELLGGDPGAEAIGLAGTAEKAIAFQAGIVRLPNSPQGWHHTVVAEKDGAIVGIMQAGSDQQDVKITPTIVYLALHTFGPLGVIRLLPRLRARRRVETRGPPGAYHIAEIDVDPAYRNGGIGGALLDHAEAEARAAGYDQMSLSTNTANPARRLYERHGFRIVETRTNSAYERLTGIEGRHLMIKELE